jgi:hypothetical protein
MASQPPANQLPMLYKDLMPLSSELHKNFRTRAAETAPFLAQTHVVPITIDEFVAVQRHYPIIFSVGDDPVPLAMMGLDEGVNVFFDDDGKLINPAYVPAFFRRYPYMLARLRPDAEELSLCFDPTSGLVGDFEEGVPLFDGDKPSEATNEILKFCEEFETSVQRTAAFVKELEEADLLIDGELSIQPSNAPQPVIYRGFKMVSDEKIRELRGDELRKMNQNGMLPLIMSHLFSLGLVTNIFSMQQIQGKGPAFSDQAAPESVEAQ